MKVLYLIAISIAVFIVTPKENKIIDIENQDGLSWSQKSLPGLSVEQTELLFKAMAWEESRHKPKAYNKREDAVGIVQIRKCVIIDVNKIILKAPVFVHDDAYEIQASQHIFFYYLSYWGKRANQRWKKPYTMELYARIWNGGPNGHRRKSTDRYWGLVSKWMKEKPWNK